jgi:ferredoxin-thioredoxin reductase catalytic subunit
MRLKGLVDEDIANYSKTSMFLIFPDCSFKCDIECGEQVCQNSALAHAPVIDIAKEEICERYITNPMTEAVVLGGLEPFDSAMDLVSFVNCLRRQYQCEDDIVIYTGYTEDEILNGAMLKNVFETICQFGNIIVKYGRFVPGQDSHFDQVLGVNLASLNQYAKRYEKGMLSSFPSKKIILNPDKDVVDAVRAALKENDGYCPCRLEKTADTKCMCKDFREQESGMCHCGLYIKEN